MSERSGIEIDYCPQCRGIWLDRGELDKIIERASNNPVSDQRGDDSDSSYKEKEKYYDKSKHYDDDKHYGHRRKKSFLGDLFDF